MTLNIDQEYKALIPPLSAEEFAQLEANILRDGCLHPIVTWEETIIDGHNRYAICKKHDLPFKIITMEFDDRDAAMDWMDTNQLGRRNLSPVDFKLALGRRYNRSKKAIGSNLPQNKLKDQNDTLDQNDTKSEPINTAAKLATQHGVSEATVKRAGKLAEAVEAHPEIKEAIASGKSIKEAMKEHEEPPTTVFNGAKFPLPEHKISDESKEKAEQAAKDSETLWLLKSTWKKANKKEKADFTKWLKSNQ
jgi:ParB-like chromosome segregation protein Spo0J